MLRSRVILFLSTGDTCRSPMAAAYLRQKLQDHGVRNVEVRTAGVSTIVGLLASQETVQILKQENLEVGRHRSNQMTHDALRRAHVVLGMTPFHVQSALRLAPEARGKVHLLKEVTKSDLKKVQIDDPMGGTLEIYRRCYTEIQEAIDRLIFMPQIIGTEVKPLEEKKSEPAPKPKAKAPEPAHAAKPAKKLAKKPAKKPAAKAAKPTPKKPVKKPAKKLAKKPAKKPAAKATKPAPKKKAASKPKPAVKRKPTSKATTKKAAKKTTKKSSSKPAKKKVTKKKTGRR